MEGKPSHEGSRMGFLKDAEGDRDALRVGEHHHGRRRSTPPRGAEREERSVHVNVPCVMREERLCAAVGSQVQSTW